MVRVQERRRLRNLDPRGDGAPSAGHDLLPAGAQRELHEPPCLILVARAYRHAVRVRVQDADLLAVPRQLRDVPVEVGGGTERRRGPA